MTMMTTIEPDDDDDDDDDDAAAEDDHCYDCAEDDAHYKNGEAREDSSETIVVSFSSGIFYCCYNYFSCTLSFGF